MPWEDSGWDDSEDGLPGMIRVGVGRPMGGGVEGRSWRGGASESVVMMTGGGLSRDIVERRS